MKRHTIYQAMNGKNGGKPYVQEAQGYLYSITGPDNKKTLVGLVYKRPYWFATHYETGMCCTPYKGRGPRVKHWMKREELLEALGKLNFTKLEEQELAKKCFRLIQRYREEKNNREISTKKA